MLNSNSILSIVESNTSLFEDINSDCFSFSSKQFPDVDTCHGLDIRNFLAWYDLQYSVGTNEQSIEYDVLKFKEYQNSAWAEHRVDKVNNLLTLPNSVQNFQSSLRYINEAIELVPMKPSHYYLRGKLYLKYSNPNQALKDYEIARKLDESIVCNMKSREVANISLNVHKNEKHSTSHSSSKSSSVQSSSSILAVPTAVSVPESRVSRDKRTLELLDAMYDGQEHRGKKHKGEHHHHKHHKHKHNKHH